MHLINHEISLDLTWLAESVICKADKTTIFTATDTGCYVPVITLSTQDNSKLLQQVKSGFKQTIN